MRGSHLLGNVARSGNNPQMFDKIMSSGHPLLLHQSADFGVLSLIRKLATLIPLAIVFSGSFTLSTQFVEAKTSRSSSLRARNYFVPPPPPYIPTIIPSALGITNAQALTADNAVVEKVAKTPRSSSGRAGNYLVPPPPPYTPSMVTSALGWTNSQAVAAADAIVEKPVNTKQGDMPQVVQSNPYISYHRGVETKIQKEIDYFDSEISSREKEIGKLLNL